MVIISFVTYFQYIDILFMLFINTFINNVNNVLQDLEFIHSSELGCQFNANS